MNYKFILSDSEKYSIDILLNCYIVAQRYFFVILPCPPRAETPRE
jgi:hypothetical protein